MFRFAARLIATNLRARSLRRGEERRATLRHVRRFDVIPPTPPRPYITRGADALWFMPFVMIYAIPNAYRQL